MEIDFACQKFLILPEAAVFWPDQEALILADLHLGKAHVFQRHGLAVPFGASFADLAKIAYMCRRYPIKKLWILGDLIHGEIQNEALWQAFSEQLQALNLDEYILIEGNHDRKILKLDFLKKIKFLEKSSIIFSHQSIERYNPKFSIFGHVHPVYRLNVDGQNLRLKCFVRSPDKLILPSFGEFTGGYLVTKNENDIFVIAEQKIFQL